MRKILFVVHDFPPASNGVFRPLKFVRYLPTLGWQPIVLTLESDSYSSRDDSLCEQIPKEAQVYRTRTMLPEKRSAEFRKKHSASGESQISTRQIGLKDQIAIWIRNYLLIPDTKILWMPYALRMAKRIFREHPDIELILATAPPYSSFLLGYWLKKRYRKKLVLDFRDPWTQWFGAYRQWENPLRKRVEYWMERRLLTGAEGVVATTPSMRDYLREQSGSPGSSEKFALIYNGFDPLDFEEVESRSFDRFTIVYTGKVALDLYSPEPIFVALRELLAEHPELKSRIELLFLGFFPPEGREMIERYQLASVVKVGDEVSHGECIRHQKGAHLLLLLLNEGVTSEFTISGKLFEYFFAARPILAVIPSTSAAANLIEEAAAGIVIEPKETEKIAQYIYECYEAFTSGKAIMTTSTQGLRRFHRRELTHELALFINQI